MEPVLKWIFLVSVYFGFLLSGRSDAAVYAPCNIPTAMQGDWQVMDSTNTQVDYAITLSARGLSGITFWNKTLNYDCYILSQTYYVFISETTDLFDFYNVNIYFCWYVWSYPGYQLRIYELSDKVLYTLEERAKAYLNTSTPSINDICETQFDTSLPFRMMQGNVVFVTSSTDLERGASISAHASLYLLLCALVSGFFV